MSVTKPPRVKAKAPNTSERRPKPFPERALWRGLPAALMLLASLTIALGCGGGRRINMDPDIDLSAPPTTEQLTSDEPEVDAYADLLEPTRLAFQAFGYSVRPPLGWREPEQRPTTAVDLNFIRPGGSASIAILRDRIAYGSYSAWIADMRGRLDAMENNLNEFQLVGWRIESRGGHLLFRVDHNHQVKGQYYRSSKAMLYGGDVLITIDFNAETEIAGELMPSFEAFLDTFRLADEEAARLLIPDEDFVADYVSPGDRLKIPVPRHFVRDDVAQSRSVLARWSLARNITITFAQHGLPSIGLEAYGDFQIGVLRDAGNQPGKHGVREMGRHAVYRIEFTTKAGTPGLFYIFDARDRYLQLIFLCDEVSMPMLAPVIDEMVSRATVKLP